jgi:hypothetical protein
VNVRIAEGKKPFHRNMICAYCHDDISDAAVVCAGCGVACHADCKTGECPTIACKWSKDKPQAQTRGMLFRQLKKADNRHTNIFAPIQILFGLTILVATICHVMELVDLGVAWLNISHSAIALLLLLNCARTLLSGRYEAKIEQLCEDMIENEKTSQAEIAHLRSAQVENKK